MVIQYLVDGRNRRVARLVNGIATQYYLYQNALSPIAELDAAGNPISRFIYGAKPNIPEFMVKGGLTYKIVSDHLGSPRLVVNTHDGTIAQRMDYDEFGRVTHDTNPGFQPFGFAGGLYDPFTGLTRFGARDYEGQFGRWLSKDPIRIKGGVNLYSYAINDPINFVDPNGESVLDIIDGISSPSDGAAIGAIIGGAIGGFLGNVPGALVGGYIGAEIGEWLDPNPIPNDATELLHREFHGPNHMDGFPRPPESTPFDKIIDPNAGKPQYCPLG